MYAFGSVGLSLLPVSQLPDHQIQHLICPVRHDIDRIEVPLDQEYLERFADRYCTIFAAIDETASTKGKAAADTCVNAWLNS